VETSELQDTLSCIPLGGRLLVRSKKDWRVAVVSRIAEGSITLSVASPRGGTYRLRRVPETLIAFDGLIPYLQFEPIENWRDNFSVYDLRW
jgi:hypothetical protein